MRGSATTLSGLLGILVSVSQGSSLLATLGWMMESRWDSRSTPQGFREAALSVVVGATKAVGVPKRRFPETLRRTPQRKRLPAALFVLALQHSSTAPTVPARRFPLHRRPNHYGRR